jgi:PRC-barrel domain
MAAFDPATLDRWRALAIVDRDGTTVGTISEFYLDRETGHPTWALVETGLFGATQTFVPLVHATEIEDGLQVPYEKRHIKDSPRVDPQDELTPDEEATLFAHYGVAYDLAAADLGIAESAEAGPEAVTPEGPGPVPVDTATDQEVKAEAPGSIPTEPGTAEEPGPVLSGSGTAEEPGSVPEEAETAEEPGSVPVEPGAAEEPRSVPEEPGTAEGPELVPGEPGTTEGPGPVPEEPGTTEGPETAAGPDDATLITPGGFGSASDHPEGLPDPDSSGSPSDRAGDAPGPDLSGSASDHPGGAPDPDLSRTAPVEPGLPGSTAASPGPVPITVDKDTADPDRRTADEPLRDPDDLQWPPVPAGSFDEHPADRPTGSSDRWREAKLAAERERIAREAAQSEERSPLERARRRLERLVGVGQDHSDDDIAASDREAAERARRARLGFDEDDPRFR